MGESESQQKAVFVLVRRLKMSPYPSHKFTFLSHGLIMPKYVTATTFHDATIFLGNSNVLSSF